MRTVSVIVPVYHNAESLPVLLRRLQSMADKEPEQFEFIFVDDGSHHDNSFPVLEELAQTDPRIKALRLARNFGSNAASSAGIAYARGDCVVAISADLQDPPELIGELLTQWRLGSKVVLATRRGRVDPWLTKATSQAFWWLFRRYGLPNFPEQGCDYVLIDRQVLNVLADINEPNGGIGMVLWTGFQPAYVEYDRVARDPNYGKSQWTFGKKITYFIDLFVSFSDKPIRAVSVMGLMMALLGFLYACAIVISWWQGSRDLVAGWSSTIVILLLVSGVQLIMLGVLGEYQLRMLQTIRKRPPFVIDRVVDPSRAQQRQREPQPIDEDL
ncbi:MAG: glycosyltransferase family 2 protein [Pirellulales bacterium]|nr:glycosyltransferase family 2 protein [Pirellulales bacterium]